MTIKPSPRSEIAVTPSQDASNSAITNEMHVSVTGSNFAFDPKEIHAKVGQKITITFTNSNGFHDFVIDEFNVHTAKIAAEKSEDVVFTASKKGSFEYYCSVGNHRQMGMVGTLIVE